MTEIKQRSDRVILHLNKYYYGSGRKEHRYLTIKNSTLCMHFNTMNWDEIIGNACQVSQTYILRTCDYYIEGCYYRCMDSTICQRLNGKYKQGLISWIPDSDCARDDTTGNEEWGYPLHQQTQSLGGEWSKFNITLRYLSKMTGIYYKFHYRICALRSFENVTIIRPASYNRLHDFDISDMMTQAFRKSQWILTSGHTSCSAKFNKVRHIYANQMRESCIRYTMELEIWNRKKITSELFHEKHILSLDCNKSNISRFPHR